MQTSVFVHATRCVDIGPADPSLAWWASGVVRSFEAGKGTQLSNDAAFLRMARQSFCHRVP
eukprot:5383672-Amphidinium_carterae.1